MRHPGVYLISDGIDKIKIGVAIDPEKRLKQLQTGHANTLAIVDYDWLSKDAGDAYKREKELHHRYKHLHIKNEWFHWTPEVTLRGYIEINKLGATCGQFVAREAFPEKDALDMALENSGGVQEFCNTYRPYIEAGAGRKLNENEMKNAQQFIIKTMWTSGYQWGLNRPWDGKEELSA